MFVGRDVGVRRFPHEGRVFSASLWRLRVAVTGLGRLCVGREARRVRACCLTFLSVLASVLV